MALYQLPTGEYIDLQRVSLLELPCEAGWAGEDKRYSVRLLINGYWMTIPFKTQGGAMSWLTCMAMACGYNGEGPRAMEGNNSHAI